MVLFPMIHAQAKKGFFFNSKTMLWQKPVAGKPFYEKWG
jgi:hypothetical protein